MKSNGETNLAVVEINHHRKQLVEFLGEEKISRYYQYLKLWFSGKSEKDNFDLMARSLFTSESIHLHNQFLLSLLNSCDIRVPGADVKHDGALKALKRSLSRAKRLKRNPSFQKAFSPAPVLTKESVPEVIFNRKRESTDSAPLYPSIQCASTDGFLPDPSMTSGRLLVSCWENDLDGMAEEVSELVLFAMEALLKNLFTVVVQMKKSFELKDNRFAHNFGLESQPLSLSSRDKDQNLLTLNNYFDLVESKKEIPGQRNTGETSVGLGVKDFFLALKVKISVIPNVELREKFLERLLCSWRHSTVTMMESTRSVQNILNTSRSDSEEMSS